MSVATTWYLKMTKFGFTIPTNSTINGIVVEIKKYSSQNNTTNYILDNIVRIVKSDGSFGTTNRADTSTKWGVSPNYVTYGNDTDLWGDTWSSSDINNDNFGVALSVTITYDSSTSALVDTARITVYYTENTDPSTFNGRAYVDKSSSNKVLSQTSTGRILVY